MIVPTQNDERLNMISKYGCYFMSVLYIYADATNSIYNPDMVVKAYTDAVTAKAIRFTTFVEKPSLLCKVLGGKIDFVGHKPVDYVCKAGEYEILRFVRASDGYVHFVVGDGNGKVKWDPWPNSRTVREGKLMDKRIYKIV